MAANFTRFDDLELSPEVRRALEELGFTHPTPIQQEAIPVIQKGQDVIGKAETGTGKTLAFGLPMIEKLDAERVAVQALILAPTRELAQQVASQLEEVAKHRGIGVALTVGGEPLPEQILAMAGRQIVVGTPGRVLDLLRMRRLRLEWATMVVLDEADRMLDMGFVDDVAAILGKVPKERQTLLFSATLPQAILGLAKRFMRRPVRIETASGLKTPSKIRQSVHRLSPYQRFNALRNLIDENAEDTFLVFCNTRRDVRRIEGELWGRGYPTAALSGDFDQSVRFKVMERFRSRETRVLVATDVASRGLDIDHIAHVVNWGVPEDVEDYVHRIGRTGRAGRTGLVTTFVTPEERERFARIRRRLGDRIEEVEDEGSTPRRAQNNSRGSGDPSMNGPRRRTWRGPRREERADDDQRSSNADEPRREDQGSDPKRDTGDLDRGPRRRGGRRRPSRSGGSDGPASQERSPRASEDRPSEDRSRGSRRSSSDSRTRSETGRSRPASSDARGGRRREEPWHTDIFSQEHDDEVPSFLDEIDDSPVASDRGSQADSEKPRGRGRQRRSNFDSLDQAGDDERSKVKDDSFESDWSSPSFYEKAAADRDEQPRGGRRSGGSSGSARGGRDSRERASGRDDDRPHRGRDDNDRSGGRGRDDDSRSGRGRDDDSRSGRGRDDDRRSGRGQDDDRAPRDRDADRPRRGRGRDEDRRDSDEPSRPRQRPRVETSRGEPASRSEDRDSARSRRSSAFEAELEEDKFGGGLYEETAQEKLGRRSDTFEPEVDEEQAFESVPKKIEAPADGPTSVHDLPFGAGILEPFEEEVEFDEQPMNRLWEPRMRGGKRVTEPKAEPKAESSSSSSRRDDRGGSRGGRSSGGGGRGGPGGGGGRRGGPGGSGGGRRR